MDNVVIKLLPQPDWVFQLKSIYERRLGIMCQKCDVKTNTPQAPYCKCNPKPCCDSYPSKPETYMIYCRPKPCPERECENTVHVDTNVSISQTAKANGGNANGGNGGSAGGSAAASAASGENASANSTASVTLGEGLSGGPEDPEPRQDGEALQEESTASASVGSATGGSGGAGGTGGNGGTASNAASVQVDNMIIVCCDGKGPGTALKLGTNDRKIDVTVDRDGNTYVNGKKMDEEVLENGTKVFIFRNSEANMTEA